MSCRTAMRHPVYAANVICCSLCFLDAAPPCGMTIARSLLGLMIEVHNNPAKALCDGAQSIDPDAFDELMKDIKRRVEFEGKTLG